MSKSPALPTGHGTLRSVLPANLPPDLDSFSDGIDPVPPETPAEQGEAEYAPPDSPRPDAVGSVGTQPAAPSPYREGADPLLIETLDVLDQIVFGQLLTPFARTVWTTCYDLANRVREAVMTPEAVERIRNDPNSVIKLPPSLVERSSTEPR